MPKIRKGLGQVIQETIMKGKIPAEGSWFGTLSQAFNLYPDIDTVNKDKVDYALMRSIYHAMPMTFEGSTKGREYIYGAIFAKAIVNSAAAFAIGDMPTVNTDETDNDNLVQMVINNRLDEKRDKIYDWVKSAYRDGDAYIMFNGGEPRVVDPRNVDEIVDPKNGKVLGYDFKYALKEDTGNSKNKTVYVLEIRETGEQLYKIKDGKKIAEGEAVTYSDGTPFRIIPIHNEPDPQSVYGNSDLQSSLNNMIAYNTVMANGLKNVVFNSTAMPVYAGIQNVDKFLEQNFDKDASGNYSMKVSNDKAVMLPPGATATVISATDTVGSTMQMLNVLFWGICQTSETPEFAFGAGLSTGLGDGGVNEQLGVMARKAIRKQGYLNQPLRDYIDYVLWFEEQFNSDLKGYEKVTYDLDFSPVISDDMTLNLNIADKLLTQGVITEETAARLCKIDNWVEDVEEEVKKAKANSDAKAEKEQQYLIDKMRPMNEALATDTKKKVEVKVEKEA